MPPFGLGFRPARGPLGRLRDGVLRRLMVRTFNQQGLATLNAARAEHGLAPLASVFDQLGRCARALVLTFDRHPNAVVAPDHVPPLIYSLPQKLRGIESNGMIVAASAGPEDRPVLVGFHEDVENGARLR